MWSRSNLKAIVGPLLGVTLLLGPAASGAQEMSREALQERLSRQRQALTEVQEELKRHSATVESNRAQERSILLEIEAADRKLAVIRTEADLAAREVAAHQARTKTLDEEVSGLEAKLARQRRTLAKHLQRLYRQRSITTAQILLTAPTLTAAAEQAKYTKRIARIDRERIMRYQATLRALRKGHRQRQSTASKRRRAQVAVYRKAENLRQQVEAKRSLLASIQRERRLNEKVLQEMEEASRDLQALVTKLERQRNALTTAETKREARSRPDSFSLLKGRVPWPAHGRLLSASGRVAKLHRGLTIEASEGGPIEAVAAGTVVFANTFRGYGNLCIIDHGKSYHTLYAHAQEFTVRVGEQVEAGQVIGRVGSSGAASTARLYFELRHRGRPIDPRLWMASLAQ